MDPARRAGCSSVRGMRWEDVGLPPAPLSSSGTLRGDTSSYNSAGFLKFPLSKSFAKDLILLSYF